MADDKRTVGVEIKVGTAGTEDVKKLGDTIKGVGDAAGGSVADAQRLAAELEKLTAETATKREAERAARTEADAQRAALNAQRDALAKLRIETDSAGRATDEYKAAVRAAQLQIIDSRAALRAKTEAVNAAATAARVAAATEEQAAAKVREAHAAAAASARASADQQVAANKRAGDSLGVLGSAVGGIESAFGKLGAAAAAAFTGREFVQTILQAEAMRRGLVAVTGSTEKASAELSFLKKTANELGLDIESTGQAYLSLSAATKGTALEGEATREVFVAVSRAMSTLGKSAADTERAMQAVSQMASKGTVSMEELRGQLGEALPGALQAAANGAGKTTQQLIAMVESGNVLAKDLLPALTKGLNDLYEKGGPPDTLQANWNRLKNAISETAVALGEGGASRGLTTIAGGATVALTSASEAVKLVGAGLGEMTAAAVNGNVGLFDLKERSREAAERIDRVAQAAGLATPQIKAIGDAAQSAGSVAQDAFRRIELQAQNTPNTIGQAVIDLGLKFDGLRAKGDSAAEAVAKIGKDFDLTTSPGIRQAEEVLTALLRNAQIDAKQFADAWSDALKGVDLSDFETRARKAFEGTSGEARKLQAVVDAIGNESLRRAGSSADELRTGISRAMSSAIADVDALSATLQRMGATGDRASALLYKSLTDALGKANTVEAVQAVVTRLETLGAAGRVAGDAVATGLDAAKRKIDDMRSGVSSLDEALRAFGLRTQAEMKATADKLGEAWQRIQNDTTVSVSVQRQAFDAWAKAATDANGGVETSAVKTARAMLEIREAAQRAGRDTADAMSTAGSSVDALRGKAQAAASAVAGIGKSQSIGYQSTTGNTREERLAGQNAVDNTFAYGIVQRYMAGDRNFSDVDLSAAQRALAAERSNLTLTQDSFTKGFTSLQGIRDQEGVVRALEDVVSRLQQQAQAAQRSGSDTTSSGSTGSRTVNVNIGGRTRSVAVASQSDSDTLVAMLRDIETASARAG